MWLAQICANTDDSNSLIRQRQSKRHDYRKVVSEQMCVKSYVHPLCKIGRKFSVGTTSRFLSDVIAYGSLLSAACAPKRRSYTAQTQLGDRNGLITTPRRPCWGRHDCRVYD